MATSERDQPPPRRRKTSGPWVPLLCIALGVLAIWFVIRLSPERNLLTGQAELALSQIRLPEMLQFLDGHVPAVVAGVVLALFVWLLFRRPRAR